MKKNKKKVKLDLEILELESKIAPDELCIGGCADYAVQLGGGVSGAEC